MSPSDARSDPVVSRQTTQTPRTGEAAVRIDRPSQRLTFRAPATFNAQASWAIALLAVVLIYLGAALGFQHEYNARTVEVFGQITEQEAMPWYYAHPWFGALVLAGLPALAVAAILVLVLEARFHSRQARTELADLNLLLQHTGYRLQGHLDRMAGPGDHQ